MYGLMEGILLDFGKKENNIDWGNILMKMKMINSGFGFMGKETDGLMIVKLIY